MDIKDICNAGGDILDAVADAVNRNDYSGLSDNVSSTVSRVISRVREDAGKGTYGDPTHQYGRTVYTRKGQAAYRSVYDKKSSRYDSIYKKKQTIKDTIHKNLDINIEKGSYVRNRREQKLPPAVTTRPAGRISGPLQLAWGILGTSGFGITALVMTILLAAKGGTVFLILSVVFGVLTACSISDIVRGSRKISLLNRFYRYVRLIGSRGFITVEELAFQTGQKKDDVLRDLRKMMKKHMFLQGRLDNTQTTFMLTQEAYGQYLEAEQSRQRMEADIKADTQACAEQQDEAQSARADTQAGRILKEGNDYIRMVQECNRKIQNEKMRSKLSRLEVIMRRIFEQVEKDPSSADDLHKFMDYYLPTTTKLLNAYIDLDRQEIAGEHILATKKEIEDTFDIINSAFEKLLDGLFEDTAWDISSDISVMKTMMAQEGLTENQDFKMKTDL